MSVESGKDASLRQGVISDYIQYSRLGQVPGDVKDAYNEILEDVVDQTGGPRGMGWDPNDPRGPWQMAEPSTQSRVDNTNMNRDRQGADGRGAFGVGQDTHRDHQATASMQQGQTRTTTTTRQVETPAGTRTVTQTTRTDYQGRTEDDPNFTGVRPVLLDLDGNGVSVAELGRSTVFLDSDGDGLANRTAWAGVGDGVLFYDAGGDGQITQDREFVFTEWDPTAKDDMAALRSRFDSNNDGKLTSADAEWSSFKVMVTDDHGTQSAQSLSSLGITEIDLKTNATEIHFADGSEITGQTTFTINGQTRTAATVTLVSEADGHRVVQSTSGATTTWTTYDSTGQELRSLTSTRAVSGNTTTTTDTRGLGRAVKARRSFCPEEALRANVRSFMGSKAFAGCELQRPAVGGAPYQRPVVAAQRRRPRRVNSERVSWPCATRAGSVAARRRRGAVCQAASAAGPIRRRARRA